MTVQHYDDCLTTVYQLSHCTVLPSGVSDETSAMIRAVLYKAIAEPGFAGLSAEANETSG